MHSRTKARTAIIVLATLFATSVGVAAFSTPANSATVYNRFERTCFIGNTSCSKYAQTNPPYRPEFGSDCVTKRVIGADSMYHVGPGQKCTD